jgi:hypothetical protein
MSVKRKFIFIVGETVNYAFRYYGTIVMFVTVVESCHGYIEVGNPEEKEGTRRK